MAETLSTLAGIELAIAAGVTLLAGLMRGFAGFGVPLVLAPVFAILYGPAVAVPAIVLMELPTSVQLVPRAVRDVDWRLTLGICAGSLVFVPVGTWLLAWLDAELVRRVIAVVLVGFVGVLISGWRYHGPRPLWANVAVGATSGALKGLTSFGGPPVLLYLLSGPEAAIRHRANLILMVAIMNVFATVSFAVAGLVTPGALALAAVLLPVLMAGVWAGARLFAFASERIFRRVALAFLLAIGIVSLIA